MPSDDERIGGTLGRYRILGRIGRGHLGTLFLAEHDQLERRAALRVFDVRDAAFKARLIENVRAAADVSHPGLVAIYDVGEAEDGAAYLATRYVAGQDLHTILIQDGALDLDRAVAIVEQVADALGAIHAGGRVHGSVRPAAILLESSTGGHARAYLSDGWVAGLEPDRGSSDDSGLGAAVEAGAPEVARDGQATARTDVYALGQVLARSLTGASSPPERVAIANLPVGVDRVVARALAADPDDRQRDGAELAADLRSAVAARPSRRPTQPLTPAPVGRRPRSWVVGTMVVALAAAVVATVVLEGGSGANVPAAPAAAKGPIGILGYDQVEKVSDIATVSPHAGVPAVLTHGKVDRDAVWSPSGKEIAFLRSAKIDSENARLMIMRPDGSGVRALVKGTMVFGGGFGADGPFTKQLAWSPSGSRLALTAVDSNHLASLQIMNSDGSGLHTIVRHCRATSSPQCVASVVIVSPTWAPNGKMIAFVAGRFSVNRIYLVSPDGSEVRSLVHVPGAQVFEYDPAWSPDGKTVAFDMCQNGDNSRCSIYVVAPDGSDLRHLSTGQTDAWDPTWSPDGRYLAYECELGNLDNLCVMRADGGDQHIVLRGTNASQPYGLAWAP